jgi:hypothetical protein
MYFDFAARNPMIVNRDLLEVFKILVKDKKLDHTFMYAYNVSPGRLSRSKEAVSAKNILSFGFGFDAMGRKHKRPNFDPKRGMVGNADTEEKKMRLFNRYDYGYYRVLGSERIKEIYPKDEPCLNVDAFMKALSSKSSLRRCEALINNEQLGREALNLQGVIKHERLSDYLSEKTYVKKPYIKTIKEYRNNVVQTSLTP